MTTDHCRACEENERIKKEAGHGPWSKEPNRVEFKHGGFHCILHRGGLAAWCGYVGVGPDHPAHGKQYDDVDVEVHGGLTYAEKCQGHVCHVPAPGEPDDLWWLGFDCSHFMDLAPGSLAIEHRFPTTIGILDRGRYWTVEDVTTETRRLAEQLAAMVSP